MKDKILTTLKVINVERLEAEEVITNVFDVLGGVPFMILEKQCLDSGKRRHIVKTYAVAPYEENLFAFDFNLDCEDLVEDSEIEVNEVVVMPQIHLNYVVKNSD